MTSLRDSLTAHSKEQTLADIETAKTAANDYERDLLFDYDHQVRRDGKNLTKKQRSVLEKVLARASRRLQEAAEETAPVSPSSMHLREYLDRLETLGASDKLKRLLTRLLTKVDEMDFDQLDAACDWIEDHNQEELSGMLLPPLSPWRVSHRTKAIMES